MARSLRRGLIGLALAAGMAAGTVGPAAAQTLTVSDARGDVMRYVMPADETAEPEGVLDPSVTNGDVLRTTIRHSAKRIAVRVKFAELKRAGMFRGDFLSLRTNEGVRREVSLMAGAGMWRGQADMTRPNGRPVQCAIRHRIDYDTDVVTMSFPRRCASSPRWVEVGLASMWVKTDGETFYVDDAQRDSGMGNRPVWSPRVRRG